MVLLKENSHIVEHQKIILFEGIFVFFRMLPDPEAAGSEDIFTRFKLLGNMIGVSFLTCSIRGIFEYGT